jgi:hypothetical protein
LNDQRLDIIEILIPLFYLGLLFSLAYFKKQKIAAQENEGFFFIGLFYKLLFALFFGGYYYLYVKGGDSVAYWQGANVLSNLFFESPINYVDCLFSNPSPELIGQHFNSVTGYPPGWLYRENEAWLVCKLFSFLSIITYKSYAAMSIIVCYFSFLGSWRLMELVGNMQKHARGNLIFAFIFIPSLCFWCTGLSKDTIVYIFVVYLLIRLFKIIAGEKIKLSNLIQVLLCSYIIYHTRSFVLIAILAAAIMAYGARITKRFESNSLAKVGFRFLYLSLGIFMVYIFFTSQIITNILTEASVIQKDFINNEIYTGQKYEIGVINASPMGLISAFPSSLVFGIYRPFIQESLSPSLIFNGLESLLLIFLTLRFFVSFNIINKIQQIRKNEFLMFALIFIIIIGFISGLTSVLFGVLVRVRAIILPFIYLLLTVRGSKTPVEIPLVKDN